MTNDELETCRYFILALACQRTKSLRKPKWSLKYSPKPSGKATRDFRLNERSGNGAKTRFSRDWIGAGPYFSLTNGTQIAAKKSAIRIQSSKALNFRGSAICWSAMFCLALRS